MTSQHLDDVPPPPYTETDIYSNAGGHSRRSNSNGTDDASSAASTGEIIYTPPLTPRSSHQQNFVSEADRLTTTSAEAYFDSRPPPRLSASAQGELIVHPISIKVDSNPSDFPYIRDWSQRDVRVEDWQTFVNYLIPHYSAEANENLVDRKLRAEGVSDDMLSAKSGNRGDRSPVVAQLEQIRTPTETAQRRHDAEETVREWNDGFFGPRGINIHIELSADDIRVPGAWDQSFDQNGPEQAAAAQTQQPGSRWRRFNPLGGGFNSDSRGFTFAGITLDGDRLAIGNNVVADRNGLRIGGLVFDNNGIRNGSSTFPGPGQRGIRSPGFPHLPGFSSVPNFGTGPGAYPTPGMPPADCGIDEPHRHSPTGRCKGTQGPDRHECGQERGRGPRRGHHGRRVRSRSSSTSSSSSSCSSGSDASSVGSLPDWDDLKDQQLPATKHYLEELLSHPENMITKENVRQVKDQIKAAKRENSGGFNEAVNMAYDKKVLRQEVKALMQQWKALKRQQGQMRRQLKREKKQQRRAEKRERRQIKRELRKAKRELRHGRRHSHGPRGGHGPFEGIPGVPSPGPHMHPWFGPGQAGPGFGRGFGPGCGAPSNTPMRETGDVGGNRKPWQRLQERMANRREAWDRGWVTGPPRGQPSSKQEGSKQERFPGTWPDDSEDTAVAIDPHIASQAMYQAAENVQKELVQKKTKLAKLRDQPPDQGEKSEASKAAAAGMLQGFELEIHALEQTVQKLNLKADEAYARELEQEDHRQQNL